MESMVADQEDPADAVADGVLSQAEGDSVGVTLGDRSSRLIDEPANQGVEDAGGPQLLANAELGLRAQAAVMALADLDFPGQGLAFPALVVDLGQFDSVRPAGANHIDEHPPPLPS